MSINLLHIDNISVNYEQYRVLENQSAQINVGEIVCILGKNGAGKSTFLKSIAGLVNVSEGDILFEEKSILDSTTKERISLGIGYLMQHDAIFPRLTIADHIELGALQNHKKTIKEIWEEINLYFPNLIQIKKDLAGRLSGGQRRLLSLATLVAQGADKLWLLDEPSAGIAKGQLDIIENFLTQYLPQSKISCLLVEQNKPFGERIAQRNIFL
jgi:ABC-type branched-subunit amino acid transport system ATPase component